MKNTSRIALVMITGFAIVGLALPAWAGEFVKTIPAGDKLELTVLMRTAGVKIESWDRAVVEVRSKEDMSRGIEVKESEIRLSYKSRAGDMVAPDEDLFLKVPKTTQLDATTVSGELTLAGPVERVKLTSISGELVMKGSAGRMALKTISGDIEIKTATGDLTAGTVSGEIKGGSISGKLIELQTVSGDIVLDGLSSEQVRVKTVSGDITLGCRLSPVGTVKIATVSGDAELRLPAGAGFTAALKSRSGDLSTDFDKAEKESQGVRTRVKVGSGEAEIEMASLSGDLKIIKTK